MLDLFTYAVMVLDWLGMYVGPTLLSVVVDVPDHKVMLTKSHGAYVVIQYRTCDHKPYMGGLSEDLIWKISACVDFRVP